MRIKRFSHFSNKKWQHICNIYVLNFNQTLTNDDVNFKQLVPECKPKQATNCANRDDITALVSSAFRRFFVHLDKEIKDQYGLLIIPKKLLIDLQRSGDLDNLSRVMRKPGFCI